MFTIRLPAGVDVWGLHLGGALLAGGSRVPTLLAVPAVQGLARHQHGARGSRLDGRVQAPLLPPPTGPQGQY